MLLVREVKNLWRKLRKKPIGFVYVVLEGEIPIVHESKSFIENKVFPQPPISILSLLENTDILLADDRVHGLIIEIRSLELRYATIESLRQVIMKWKAAGKPTIVHSQDLNFAGYYLACAADEIFMTPGGVLSVMGVGLSISFFKQYLEEKGVQTQVVHVSKYKSAFNNFAYDEMPEEQRENLEWLTNGIFDQVVAEIAKSRTLELDEVIAFIDSAPHMDMDALEHGWIDGINSPAEVADDIKKRYNTEVTYYNDAMKRVIIPKRPRPNIAIIPIIGSIVDGRGRSRKYPIPLFGNRQAGDITISQYIRSVIKNKKIQAAVIYVDSPGGSVTASEAMLNEIRKLADEIPVVAYFNDVSASGGYYLSMYTDMIITQPLTITASIGVIFPKISMKEFYESRNIKRYEITRGRNANMFTANDLWNEEQYEKVKELVFNMYDKFKGHVSRNRKMTLDEVEKIAGGRVYLGKQAIELGLVDKLGGIEDAIMEAAKMADVDSPSVMVATKVKKELPPLPLPEDLPDAISKLTNRALYMDDYIIDFF